MINEIREAFKNRFGTDGTLYASPGRVNLIGEHTDFNLGFVLPGAIDKAIYAVVEPNGGSLCRIYSYDYGESAEFEVGSEELPSREWARYLFGVVKEMRKRGRSPEGFDCVFGGDVPLGAGLSSSAALESVIGYALNDTFGLGFDRYDLAQIGQMCEHNYVGVNCGIMDQFASLFGEKGKVIKLDCRSLEYELMPFDPAGYKVVLFDTKVKHSLASSEYNVRRAQCEAGVAAVKKHIPSVESLRDITLDLLDTYKKEMDPVAYRRCHYVISENQRLLDGCKALEAGDYRAFGRYMRGSHEGLSGWYEVSCPELDFLADHAAQYDGVIGARMMGGGYGGCTINVIEEPIYDTVAHELSEKYEKRFGFAPRVIDVVIGDGARKLDV